MTSTDLSALESLPGHVRRAFEGAHRMMTLELQGNLAANSPVDHGNLANSWRVQRHGALVSSVDTSVAYALFVNEGTAPHDIYPKTARALRFTVGGRTVYAKHVHHPGTQGTHYIEQSIEQVDNRAQHFVDQALAQAGLT